MSPTFSNIFLSIVSPVVIKPIATGIVLTKSISTSAAATTSIVEVVVVESLATLVALPELIATEIASAALVVLEAASTALITATTPTTVLPVPTVVVVGNLIGERIRQHHSGTAGIAGDFAHHLLLVLVDTAAQLLEGAQVGTGTTAATTAAGTQTTALVRSGVVRIALAATR